MQSSLNLLRNMKRNSKTNEIEGEQVSGVDLSGGLGLRFFDKMSNYLDKIQQLDTISGITESHGSVRGRAIQLSLALKAKNIKENDIIIISSRSHSDQTIVVLAALYIGAVVAPVHADLSFKEYLDVVNKLKPKICFCDIRALSQIERVLHQLNYQSIIVCFGNDVPSDKFSFTNLVNSYKEDTKFIPLFIDDAKNKVAFILPTQGTCDQIKLVLLSHSNVLFQTHLYLEIIGHPKKMLSFFPLSWSLQLMAMCASFEEPITRILPGQFSERACCKLIQDLDIDHVLLGTIYARKLIKNVAIQDYNLSSLQTMIVGGTRSNKEDIIQMRVLLPKLKVLQTYHTTETGNIAAIPLDKYQTALQKPDSVGMVLPNIRIRVVDMDTGEMLGPDKLGQLYYCGVGLMMGSGDAMCFVAPTGFLVATTRKIVGMVLPNIRIRVVDTEEMLGPDKLGQLYYCGVGLMMGYFKNSKATLAAMEKGFFKTNDIAHYDKEGWLYIDGRVMDYVVLNEFERFTTREIEAVINMHALVSETVLLVEGKEMVACIIKRPETNLSVDKLVAYLDERLPKEKQPTKYLFMEDFPRTVLGKIKKGALREKIFDERLELIESLADIAFKS